LVEKHEECLLQKYDTPKTFRYKSLQSSSCSVAKVPSLMWEVCKDLAA